MSARFTLEEAALAAAARVETPGPLASGGSFAGVFTDTRQPLRGGLFVALAGEHHDGAAFAASAAREGAAGVLVPSAAAGTLATQLHQERIGCAVLGAQDTGRALLGLGRAWRGKQHALLPVAITGSTGKTSTKDLIASVLAAEGPTLKTEGNLNNEIGVPLTLLRLGPEHRFAAVECGMNHLGEIARLCAAVDPEVGVVTNVGPVHLEGCGSLAGVAHAKGELFHGLRPGRTAVANADDPLVREQARLARRPTLWFGSAEEAEVRLISAQHAGAGLEVRLSLRGAKVAVELQLLGLHHGHNAAAAAAAGLALGLSHGAIVHGLATARAHGRRMKPVLLPSGNLLIDDCYNANPASTRAALLAVATLLRSNGQPVLVLGDMLELGPTELELHREVGAIAASITPRLLVCFGPRARSLGEGAIAAGLAAGAVSFTDDPHQAVRLVQEGSRSGDVILVKGSRGMKMERISDALSGAPAAGGH